MNHQDNRQSTNAFARFRGYASGGMRWAPLLFACAVSMGCSSGRSSVDERKQFWENIVRAEVPLGTRFEDLRAWADRRSLTLTPAQEPRTYVAGLESVTVNGFVCKGFGISLEVVLAADGTVSRESVRSLGNCL